MLCLSAALAAEPSLDLADEADIQFELGVAAYQRRDYLGALEHLLISNRLVPNRNVVFNIARAYEQLGRYDEAFRHYQDYMALERDPARRLGAAEAIARIRPRVALVSVESDPPGAQVFVDRVDLGSRGQTPLVLALDPGEHAVILRRDGFHEAQRTGVRATTGQEATVQLGLEPILGSVEVQGQPAGARVRVDVEDSEPVATIPGVLRLSPGSHMLIVDAPGYRTARQLVSVQADGSVQAVVELPLITGAVVVDALEKGALIEIDGEAAGFTPAVLGAVPAGKHRLRVSLPGYRPYEAEVEVEADGRVAVTAQLRPLQEVTAASRTTQEVEDAPASVSLIPAEEIRAFGYETIYDALGGTRGLFQSNDRVYEYVGVRGFARPGDYNNRILLTLDGHALNDDQLGASYVGFDFAPDLGDVERIEVVRGPGSALYGTNAFLGVVNVVTRERESTRPSHLSLGALGHGTARARASAAGAMGDDGGWWLSAGGALSRGQDFEFDAIEQATGDGTSEGADGFGSAGARGKLWTGPWTLLAYGNHRDKRIPTGAYGTVLADEDAHSADTRAFAELRFEPALSKAVQLYSRAYVDRYDFAGRYPYVGDFVADSWHGTWTGAEARVVGEAASWFRLTGGLAVDAHLQAELQGEDRAGPYLDESPAYQSGGAYAVAEADLGRWLTASVGGRVDYFSSFGLSINPRAALIVRPGEAHTLKLLGGRAFRAPSPYELYYNDDGYTQVAATGLLPETIVSGELEYTWRIGEVSSAVVSAYYNQIDALIDLGNVGSDGILQYQNTGSVVQAAGAELELRRDWRGGWMCGLSQGYQHTREGDLLGGDELSNSPAYLASVKAAAPLLPGQVTGSTRVRFETGRLTSTGETTEPFVLWDLVLTGAVPAFRLDWAMGVKNVLDWDYGYPGGDEVLMAELPQPRRTAYVEGTVSF
ncbi:MAG: TonB-dependent receptor [Deltaproteobacteria bacterium]|nr:TonB-dependent receptor [Deltaproteobacteria bacterium]